jgi:hypothetical protein
MADALAKLLSISSDSLLPAWRAEEEGILALFGRPGAELLDLLGLKNGFFAFESALHVFPLGTSPEVLNLRDWNAPELWSGHYGDLLPRPSLFFAQEVFGDQFYISPDGVWLFRGEHAGCELISDSIAAWADVFIRNWRYYSGYDFGHDWQVTHRPLVEGERLIPKLPFVMGGEYEINNLYAGRIVEAMRFRASFAKQIANLPDGTMVQPQVLNRPDETGDRPRAD